MVIEKPHIKKAKRWRDLELAGNVERFLAGIDYQLPRCGIYYQVVYIESQIFTRRLHQMAGVAALELLGIIQADLLKNPTRGNLVRDLGGIRKARCSNPGRSKGKRGGYRYLFLYLENRGHIHLLYLLDKNEQEDLSADERKVLRSLAEHIKKAQVRL